MSRVSSRLLGLIERRAPRKPQKGFCGQPGLGSRSQNAAKRCPLPAPYLEGQPPSYRLDRAAFLEALASLECRL